MTKLKELLEMKMNQMENALSLAKRRLEGQPEGSLRISKTKNLPRFYHVLPGKSDSAGSYIPKADETLIQRLAQKDYDLSVLKLAGKRAEQLRVFLKDYDDDEIERLYRKSHPERQKRITPVEMTWEQKVEKWMSIPYVGKEFDSGRPMIMTVRGERVRSKSEKIIADHLLSRKIPYKYECPLLLQGFGVIYPDFTLLSRKTGKEVYLEHAGMMDDPIYAASAIRKHDTYVKCGILPGVQLITTYESSKNIFDMEVLDRLLDSLL